LRFLTHAFTFEELGDRLGEDLAGPDEGARCIGTFVEVNNAPARRSRHCSIHIACGLRRQASI